MHPYVRSGLMAVGIVGAKDLSSFAPGTHRVSVVYWPKQHSREDAGSFGWEFRVG